MHIPFKPLLNVPAPTLEVGVRSRSAEDARRAAEARRRLRKIAAEMQDETSDDTTLLVRHWIENEPPRSDPDADHWA